MRTRSKTLAALAAAALLVGGSAIAQADDISNKLDTTVDAVAEVMPLNVGAKGTTQLYVVPQNDDGKNGCNLTGQTTLGLSIQSSDPSVATVSPSSVTFTGCGETKTLTVTALKAGQATISASETRNTTEGTFNLAPATFTVNVAEATPANTPPTVKVAGVTAGASYNKGSVPTATCEVTDKEDGNSSFPATLSAVTGDYAADGIGSQTATCSYTDKGGLTATDSVTYSIVDRSAPVIAYTLNPTAPNGDNGWYTSDVSLTWTVTENESPSSLVKTGCTDQAITADQEETTYSCSATSAGGSAEQVDVKVKRDATAPTVSYTDASGTKGLNGWYTSEVTATFTGMDATSGPVSVTKTVGSGMAQGAAVQLDSPAFTDNAGNTTSAGAASRSFAIDLTDPTATFDSEIGTVYFGSVPAQPTCTASDAISGPQSCVVSGYSTAVGTHTLTATATDNAGRTATAEQKYTVLAWTAKGFYQPVDMNGVYNTVKGGSTVPLKFELFAGTTELTDPALISGFSAKSVTCAAGVATDDIEVTATGGTSLRYDTTAGQFVYNWKTPTGAGKCYSVTMTAKDNTTVTAYFKLK
jgi:hypothetical protein